MIPVAVLASHTAGLGVIRALGMKGVPIVVFYYDKNDMGYVSKFVHDRLHVPHPEHDEEQFIQCLLDYASYHGRCLLVPTDDATLKAASKNKSKLDKYYEVSCAGWGITEKIIDKKHTYELAGRCGIPIPKTCLPRSLSELEACEKLIGSPCLIKPCQSHQYYEIFKKKMVKVSDGRQLRKAFTEAREADVEIMMQEYIPGDDSNNVNYNTYFRGNNLLVEFTAEKVRFYPTEFGVPCVVKSRIIPEVMVLGRRLLAALGYRGYSCTEFKRDPRDGTYKLLEINGRYNRSTLLSVHCGLNFPWLEYRHLLYGEIPDQHGYREGVYWIDDVKDIVLFMRNAGRNCLRLSRYLEPYRKERIYSVYDRNDILPVCKRMTNLFTRCLKIG